jgi:hypothetical protein
MQMIVITDVVEAVIWFTILLVLAIICAHIEKKAGRKVTLYEYVLFCAFIPIWVNFQTFVKINYPVDQSFAFWVRTAFPLVVVATLYIIVKNFIKKSILNMK